MHIAVVTGGVGSERDISLRSGRAVVDALERLGYTYVLYDVPTDQDRLVADRSDIDFVRMIIHGLGGEDGALLGWLDMRGIPYQCESHDIMALTLHKRHTKLVWRAHGLPVADDVLLTDAHTDKQVLVAIASLDHTCVCKVPHEGSSQGLLFVDVDTRDVEILDFVRHHGSVLCERLIVGTEYTVSIVGQTILPVVQIMPPEGGRFDYENKYNGQTTELCPAPIDDETAERMRTIAKRAYDVLGCQQYGRVDLMMDQDGEIYLLELNTIPGMTDQSLMPLAAYTYGWIFDELVERLMG